MLRGRSASDRVLPSGDAPYSSREASCVGMLLDRVILGGPPTGLGTGKKSEGVDRTLSAAHIHFNTWTAWCKSKVITHKYLPIFVLEVRGSEVGEDSSGRVSESVILRIV